MARCPNWVKDIQSIDTERLKQSYDYVLDMMYSNPERLLRKTRLIAYLVKLDKHGTKVEP